MTVLKEKHNKNHNKNYSKLRNRGARTRPSTLMNLFVLGSLVLGSMLLALSCAPAVSVGNTDPTDPSAPGSASNISIDGSSTDGTSFTVQWTAPTNTGTKANGTALSSDEIGYRIYYLAGTADQDVPSAAMIKEDSNTQSKEVMRTLQLTVAELELGIRYFVTVASYNTFALSLEEAAPSAVVEVTTSVTTTKSLDGSFGYEKEEYDFTEGLGGTITPLNTPSIPASDTSGVSVRYSLNKSSGGDFVPAPAIDDRGVITIDSTTNAGIATYTVQAFATGYAIQSTTLTIVVNDDSIAPGAATGLAIDSTSIDSTSFTVQWVAPAETGTGPDGTALSPAEIGYRIYYLAGAAGQSIPSAELIKNNTDVQNQEVTGLLQTSITGLLPDTRYFVTIASYNTLALQLAETVSEEVEEISTGNDSTAPGAATGLAIDSTSVDSTSFVVQWVAPTDTGAGSDGTALDPSEIGYRIYYLAGTASQTSAEAIRQDSNVLTQELTGVLQARITGLLPGTRYVVTIVSFNSFTTELETASTEMVEATTSSSVANLVGSLVYEKELNEFTVGLADTITPTGTPTVPATDTSGASVSYTLERRDGTVFDPPPTIDGSGVITINSIKNAGIARYFVRAEAAGYTTQNVTITFVVVNADFAGELSYPKPLYEFKVGLGDTVTPDGSLSIPTTDTSGITIRYTLVKESGADFSSEPSIDEGSGIIRVNPITNTGIAIYVVRAEAAGYTTQNVMLTFVVVKSDFERSLSYNSTYNFNRGIEDAIVPTETPSIPTTDTSGVAIRYSLVKSSGTDYAPIPAIDPDSGIIMINSIINTGIATFVVKAEADGYNSQEVTLDIAINSKEFEGNSLAYNAVNEFTLGIGGSISPLTFPTAPSGVTIRYRLDRITTDALMPEPVIFGNGIIVINPETNAGRATYIVHAEANSYSTQSAILSIVVKNDATAPGTTTGLVIEGTGIDSSSFVAHWNAPSSTGTRLDGTALRPEEVVYRVYYLAAAAGQTIPSAESIRQNANSLIKLVTGVTNTRITGLLPSTRYFVTVTSYNSFAQLETASNDAEQVVTSALTLTFGGVLSYGQATREFGVGSVDTITPVSRPTVPGNSVAISYSIFKSGGDMFTPEPTIDVSNGAISINAISNTGTATYNVQASAVGYSTQSTAVTIIVKDGSTAPGGATGITATGTGTGGTSLAVQWTAPTNAGTKADGTALSPLEVGYQVFYIAATAGQTKPSAEEIRRNPSVQGTPITVGVTNTTITGLLPSTLYFVTVVSYNFVASLDTTSNESIEINTNSGSGTTTTDFDGILSYGTTTREFNVRSQGSIAVVSRPSIPSNTGGTISYRIARSGGVDLTPPPSINALDGNITINAITNVGTATYIAQAFATGYVTQSVTLTIIVNDVVGPTATAPGGATNIAVQAGTVEPLSFGVQWTAPTYTGTKADGTALESSEVGYRVYYTSGIAGQAIPTAESINQIGNPFFQTSATGITNLNVTGLAPNIRYFVTVVSYNFSVTPNLETTSTEVLDVTTSSTSTTNALDGSLSYGATTYEFNVRSQGNIAILSRPSIPGNAGGAINYSISRSGGVVHNPPPFINPLDGNITINPILNVGTATYIVQASATGYATQSETLTIITKSASTATAPGGATNIVVIGTGAGGTSLAVQWTAPTYTGTKADGTPLESSEVGYRVYYTSGTAGQAIPTAESINQIGNPFFQTSTTGITNINVTDLVVNIRYFVTVVSYNFSVTPTLETTSTEVLDVTTSSSGSGPTTTAFDGRLSYGAAATTTTTHEFNVGSQSGIVVVSRPSIPGNAGVSISYSIARSGGVVHNPLPTINAIDGNITINAITNVGTATYDVKASAPGYITQNVTLTITTNNAAGPTATAPGGATGITIQAGTTDDSSFGVQWTAPADRGTQADGTPLSPLDLRYTVYYLAGTAGQAIPTAEAIRQNPNALPLQTSTFGVTNIRVTELDPSTRYFVTVVSHNYYVAPTLETTSDEVTETSTSVASTTELDGFLNYGTNALEFFVRATRTPEPTFRPTIPGNPGGAIRYSIERNDGVFHNPPPTINPDNGIISINAITNAGTATYLVQAFAAGYRTKKEIVTIIIKNMELEGSLSYASTSYSFTSGAGGTITPTSMPRIKDSDLGVQGVFVSYNISSINEQFFTPRLRIDNKGAVTVVPGTGAGSVTYIVYASASGYNAAASQQITITVQ